MTGKIKAQKRFGLFSLARTAQENPSFLTTMSSIKYIYFLLVKTALAIRWYIVISCFNRISGSTDPSFPHRRLTKDTGKYFIIPGSFPQSIDQKIYRCT